MLLPVDKKSAIIKESMGQPHGFQPLTMIENMEQKSGLFKNFLLYTVAECQRHNSCRKFMVLHCWHYPGLAGSTDCHVNVTFQPFLARHLLLFAFVFCTFAAFSTSFLHVIKLLCVLYCIHQICSIGMMSRCVQIYGVDRGQHHLPALQLVWASCLPNKITL